MRPVQQLGSPGKSTAYMQRSSGRKVIRLFFCAFSLMFLVEVGEGLLYGSKQEEGMLVP